MLLVLVSSDLEYRLLGILPVRLRIAKAHSLSKFGYSTLKRKLALRVQRALMAQAPSLVNDVAY